jgi:hypothetical protein
MENLKKTHYWLNFQFNDHDSVTTPRQARAVELIKNTQLAIQVAAPVGCSDTTIIIQQENLVSTVHPPSLLSTPFARITSFAHVSIEEVRTIIAGVHSAFHRKLTRLINPLQFLQLGLESRHEYISTFMWVTALDSLLMAGNTSLFAERLTTILGPDTYVLPAIDPGGQPSFRIADIVEDLYEFRSVIAHGKVIPDKFLSTSELVNTSGEIITSYPPKSRYSQMMQESSLFLLTTVLRKIFVNGLIPTFTGMKSWKDRMKKPF